MSSNWYVYIIKATESRLYTGVTTDIKRRWSEHSDTTAVTKKGAKFFWGRKPESLMFLSKCENRSTACKEEAAIKKLKRTEKLSLIDSDRNQISRYSELSELSGLSEIRLGKAQNK